MVESHPYRVNRTANDTAERKDHAQQGCLFAIVALMRQRVKVRGHSHPEADWNKGKDGRSRQGLLVQEEVDRGDRGREEDAADLVEGDGGVGEGEVLEYHVQTHRSGQREHFEDFGPFELEETDAGPGERVEQHAGHEEMVGCEGQLRMFEQGGGEKGLVGEDLGSG